MALFLGCPPSLRPTLPSRLRSTALWRPRAAPTPRSTASGSAGNASGTNTTCCPVATRPATIRCRTGTPACRPASCPLAVQDFADAADVDVGAVRDLLLRQRWVSHAQGLHLGNLGRRHGVRHDASARCL